MTALHDRQQAHIARENARSDAASSSARTWVIVLLIAAAVVSVGLALLLSRQLGNGLRQLLAAARGIAGGDVEQRVEVRSRDELGDTGKAFREMVAYLDEMAGRGALDRRRRPRRRGQAEERERRARDRLRAHERRAARGARRQIVPRAADGEIGLARLRPASPASTTR